MMPLKILMVCLGNICRSPFAEGILGSKLPNNYFNVDSAGTGNWHIGNTPDARSISIAKENGLTFHIKKGANSEEDFITFDYIYVMDNSNYKDVIALAKNQKQKQSSAYFERIISWRKCRCSGSLLWIYRTVLTTVYKMLDEACDIITKKLI